MKKVEINVDSPRRICEDVRMNEKQLEQIQSIFDDIRRDAEIASSSESAVDHSESLQSILSLASQIQSLIS